MNRTAVTSLVAKSVGYDVPSQTLEIELHSADEPRVYQYTPVGAVRAEMFFDSAASVGRLLNELKRDEGVSCRRLELDEIANDFALVATTEDF